MEVTVAAALTAVPIPATSPARTSLADLPVGGRAIVRGLAKIDGSARRLCELGFCPGTTVVFERRAPLGDPLVFRVRGTRIALRRHDARLIEIHPPSGEDRNEE